MAGSAAGGGLVSHYSATSNSLHSIIEQQLAAEGSLVVLLQ